MVDIACLQRFDVLCCENVYEDVGTWKWCLCMYLGLCDDDPTVCIVFWLQQALAPGRLPSMGGNFTIRPLLAGQSNAAVQPPLCDDFNRYRAGSVPNDVIRMCYLTPFRMRCVIGKRRDGKAPTRTFSVRPATISQVRVSTGFRSCNKSFLTGGASGSQEA